MSRLQTRFDALKKTGQKALVTYITAGDPDLDATLELLHKSVEAGADVLELGVPFSDPMAEGPVIQAACERALEHKVGMQDVLSVVRKFRQTDADTPVVLMGYLNPVEVMGYAAFAEQAAAAGADGAITVDAPPEEADELTAALASAGLDTIYLIAPTSTPERVAKICASASGFVYYVSLKGVTGAGHLDVDAVAEKVAEIRQHTDLPIGVGFGISDAESAAKVAAVADAVVVGSAVIRRIEDNLTTSRGEMVAAVGSFIAELRAGVNNS